MLLCQERAVVAILFDERRDEYRIDITVACTR